MRPPDFCIWHVPSSVSLVSVACQPDSTKIEIPSLFQMPADYFHSKLEPIRTTMMVVDAFHDPHAFDYMTRNKGLTHIALVEFSTGTNKFEEQCPAPTFWSS